ncbi:aminoglycoside phosphotransferase [Pseudopedobacter saltans DSM 12145]|uniref:Aminoglycoside phosphotransferase n=1 Tax=Pseudopedobacter saltans (strain ATCC 51119 / DSM 12145 / JCM 21818 / CCUG 39354 / LMG 10337 / NBRC 100064 / NCIMB 13643) TaxID=762903 RepID=F0S5Q3_PSESL|nr:aminoglycoside phosphotransferase family protein [Pseudopedobacter saltans]ADY54227.1 aminoglycoside phosphotransferase [Pseudopedobacter saltans DSM 12145]
MLADILNQFGLIEDRCNIKNFGSGLINHTWLVDSGEKKYILQKINHHVFTEPEIIDDNINNIKHFLNKFYPDYLFISSVPSLKGETLIKQNGEYYRLTEFVEGSVTITTVNTEEEAYEAAKQFGKFSYLLADFNLSNLGIPLKDFHNLSLRFKQFEDAVSNGNQERVIETQTAIDELYKWKDIVDTYEKIVDENTIPKRVIHHDTKISNVLFDEFGKGICVIDLDTVMPGYFFSDVGDMMRTYLSPANEEEQDISKVSVRTEMFKAIYDGYMSEFSSNLTKEEKSLFIYSGKFIIYMQALRFLTDYLNNDTYYGAKYPKHNLSRALNQIKLLKEYLNAETEFKKIMTSGI